MKKVIAIITIIIVLFAGFYIYKIKSFENQRPEKITNAKAAMEKYLSEKGIKNGDYDLFVDYRLDSKMLGYGGYVIKVTFKDEPSVTYVYDYSGEKKISSRSMVDNSNPDNKSFKHEN
ncbi:DUF3139 domain-containing protein [Clostridium fungisolvens]|uniref:DUF3139 domain-containing protein n=1 Tax=Clostridium fungisolvens TaxID=1604897 RepID=A0A6V8SFL8_9CLOT|nr:DUF3139 domain-containing protein [Clostridium fungisolvens]GFP75382.1 hypothetical protein bsdtw1_01459 [Clostridium fungisolvens]